MATLNIDLVTTELTGNIRFTTTSSDNTTQLTDDVISNDSSLTAAISWPAIEAIDQFVTPIWYVIGIPGNLIAYAVWIQRRMRPSSGCYLAALALDECIFLILQMLYELETRWNVTLLQLPGLCEVFPVFFLTTQYLSPLLVLGFTVERYISVCHPFKREHYCTTRRAVITISALVVLSLALHAVQGYFWKFYPSTSEVVPIENNDTTSAAGNQLSMVTGECRIRPEVMEAGMASVWSVWSWVTEMAVFGLVPIAILYLNVLVIRETRQLSATDFHRSFKVKSAHTDMGKSTSVAAGCRKPCSFKRSGHNASRAAASSDGVIASNSNVSPATFRPSATTVMLLAVSFYLIATTLPVTICYVLFLSFPEGSQEMLTDDGGAARWSDPTWFRHYVYRGIRTIVEEFGMSHYACNLYIYLATGRIFRRELCRLVGRCGRQERSGAGSSVGSRRQPEVQRSAVSHRQSEALGPNSSYRDDGHNDDRHHRLQ